VKVRLIVEVDIADSIVIRPAAVVEDMANHIEITLLRRADAATVHVVETTVFRPRKETT